MESNRIQGNQTLTWHQAQGLLANKEILFAGGNAIRKEAFIVDTTWNAAAEYYFSHTTEERALIRKTGQQGKCHDGENSLGWWDPSTKTHTKNPTHDRGILICQMYLNQNGKCAYTRTGPYNILDFQVEHINPNSGDHPDNMLLVVYNVNENRKQSTMEEFVDRWYRRTLKGEEEYNKWYDDIRKASEKGQAMKVKILNMSEEELADFALTCPKKYEKYMWRVIGMSSLQSFRLTKAGIARPGGSQGNYKEVLNTVLYEYLYGNKDLAEQIYRTVRVAATQYLNGLIQNSTYSTIMCDAIELSKHPHLGYNREKFTKKVLRNTYKWPNIK